ncbi:MAG: hypothetical protein V4608_14660 [Bacteroidota bacterium]
MADNSIIDTTIYIGNVAIHEPVTVFTDFIITGLCLYFYITLNRLADNTKSTNNWKYFFLCLSAASLAGGCSHGFFEIHQGPGYKFFWLTMQALNVGSVYFAQQATLHSALNNSTNKKYWSLSYRIQLLLFFIAIFIYHNFLVVIIDSAIGLFPIMIIHFMDAKKNKNSLWIAYGIVVLCLTAIVNTIKLSFHAYFNHLDLAHLLIMINLSLIFVGVKRKAISSSAA